MRCEQVSRLLALSPDGHTVEDALAVRHIEGCLRCQAEVAQYRKLLKALRHLRTEVLSTPPGMVSGVLANLEERAEQRAVKSLLQGRRAAYVGGIAVATAAAGAGAAIVLASRSRRRLAG